MRLIDVDMFRADYKLAEKCNDCKRDSKWECDRQMYSARDICGWLDDAEIVDAEPVKHGVWVPIDDEPHEDFECSVCGYVSTASFDCSGITPNAFPYCPMCGAKMGEGDDNEDA